MRISDDNSSQNKLHSFFKENKALSSIATVMTLLSLFGRSKFARPHEFISKSGWGIQGIKICQKSLGFPFQRVYKHSMLPQEYKIKMNTIFGQVDSEWTFGFIVGIKNDDESKILNARAFRGDIDFGKYIEKDKTTTMGLIFDTVIRETVSKMTFEEVRNEHEKVRNQVIKRLSAILERAGMQIHKADIYVNASDVFWVHDRLYEDLLEKDGFYRSWNFRLF